MNEMKVQPEEIKAAEEIYVMLVKYFAVRRRGYDTDSPDIAALIAASRPPLVARLVRDLERLRSAAVALIAEVKERTGCSREPFPRLANALQPAPVLDLARIAEALEKRIEACRQEWGWRLEKWSESAGCLMPVSHDEGCEACRDLRVALASLREVTK